MTRTGRRADRITLSATLPTTQRFKPPEPCDAMTTMLFSLSDASSTICCDGLPVLMLALEFNPAALAS